jgi:hypothetical protein
VASGSALPSGASVALQATDLTTTCTSSTYQSLPSTTSSATSISSVTGTSSATGTGRRSHHLGAGAISVIVIGAVVGLLLLCTRIFMFIRSKPAFQNQHRNPGNNSLYLAPGFTGPQNELYSRPGYTNPQNMTMTELGGQPGLEPIYPPSYTNPQTYNFSHTNPHTIPVPPHEADSSGIYEADGTRKP